MDSRLFLIAIAIIGLIFLSVPVEAEYLSYQKSGEMMVRITDLSNPGQKDYTVAYTQTNNNVALQYYHASVVNYLTDYQTFFLNDSWMDLGTIDRITSWSVYTTQTYPGRNLLLYGCTAYNSGCTGIGTVSLTGTGWHNQTLGSPQNYRYLRFANDVGVASLEITEIQIHGSPPPSITSWTNSYTNNASLSIAPPVGQNVIFSITGTSQTPDFYIWTVDGVNQSNNFSSISLSFDTLQHVVNATVSNVNGTSSPVSWTINGAAYQLPSAPTIPEGSQCAVMFDKSTQQVNSIGYVLTNVDYGFLDFNSYRTEVYSTKNPLLYSFQMDKSNATEIFTISYPLPDVYTAQVVKSAPLFGDSIICTNTTQAIMGASSLFVPAIVSVGTQNNISFVLGYTPNHSTDTINIRTFDSDGNMESIYGVSDANTTMGVIYYQNVRYLKEGAYTTKLTSSAFGVLDSKASEAVLTPNNPTRHILPPSFINVSQTFYAFGDTMEYGYQIDDANYTNYSQYIAVYNWNQSATTRIISLCGKQWNWLVHLPIINGIVLNENCDTYDLQNDGFLPGLNKLSLRGQNSTADIELAYVNFTLATTDSDGWGLSVDKTSVCVGDTVKARVIVPGVSAGTLKYGVSGSLISVSVNRTVTYPFSATSAGSILFELYDDSGSLRFSQTVDIKDCVPSVTPPTTSEANALSIIDGWTQMFNLGINPISKFLFALIITVIIMLAGALATRNLGWGTLFGIIPFVFFAFIGYFPLIIDVLVVIAVGLKLRFM